MTLPGSARKRVRQPTGRGSWKRAKEAARAAGVYVDAPMQFLSPDCREAIAEHKARTDERRAVLDAGGFRRDGVALLLGSILAALGDTEKAEVLRRLESMDSYLGDPTSAAALAYARPLLEPVPPT